MGLQILFAVRRIT